ncbi:LysR family transcriptional regulator [Desertibaculum subflavum]|uniref:LysR family transcriptional regulator n=1 Tax=Desertibaculum subflavum TaxID=2268458 RepID=UPI000E668B5A
MFEWGDCRIFLTVARSGSTLAAARSLGVNQTTVARRMAALEAATGLRLFDRRQDGYRLSEDGAALMAAAEKMEQAALGLEQAVGQQRRHLGGVVRVTTTETLANDILTPWIAEFMELYPQIRVETIATERRLDLAAGEADIAIRSQKKPDDSGVVYRRLAPGAWAVYCSPAYAARRGVPRSVEELAGHSVIGVDGPLGKLDPFQWMTAVTPPDSFRTKCVSVVNMVAAIKASLGVGPLPCMQSSSEALVECFRMPDFGYSFYLVTNAALKNTPRIRAFNDFIIARAASFRQLLDGRAPETTPPAAS